MGNHAVKLPNHLVCLSFGGPDSFASGFHKRRNGDMGSSTSENCQTRDRSTMERSKWSATLMQNFGNVFTFRFTSFAP